MVLEVRCCCQPEVLLGWISLPVRHIRHNQVVPLPIVRAYSPYSDAALRPAPDHVKIRVYLFLSTDLSTEPYLAVSSCDKPLKEWLKLPEFTACNWEL